MKTPLQSLFRLAITCCVVCLAASCTTDRTDTVNAILGDASYEKTFGRSPGEASESERIWTHLTYVESLLRRQAPGHLTAGQAAQRQRLLDLLHEYTNAGIFPVNVRYKERTPCFIDGAGRICAVGYLVEKTAGREIAEQLNRRHGYEKILDMKDAVLDAWIAASGLTRLECAMIQPAYGWYPPADPIPNYNHISKEYGITSAIVGGVNISFDAVNAIQLAKGSDSKVVPAIGILMGAFQVALGINHMPEEQMDANGNYTTNESEKILSFVNIGLGTSALVLSTWNLIDQRTSRPRTAWRVFGYPGQDAAIGFSLAHRF